MELLKPLPITLAVLCTGFALPVGEAKAEVVCKNDDICVDFLSIDNPRFAHFKITGFFLANTRYHLREGSNQIEVKLGEVRFFNRDSSVSIQRCTTDVFGVTIRCTAWANFTAPSLSSTSQPLTVAGQCKNGWVWRDARPADRVCVRPIERDRAKRQNAEAVKYRLNPNTTTCRQGYVWRQAFNGDSVCVTTAERSLALKQNADAHLYVRK